LVAFNPTQEPAMPTAAEQRARYAVPEWASDADIEQHGALFIACTFRDRAHWQHYLATGESRHPRSARRQAAIDRDPVRAQREKLRKNVANCKRSIADAESKLADAQAALAEGPYTMEAYKAEKIIEEQTARLAVRRTALARAEVDFELFELIDRGTTGGPP
jgi:hypothetical protein